MSSNGGVEPPAPETPVRTESIPLGIAFMLGATVMFAVSSAIMKWMVALYPPGEILFIRVVASLAVVAAIVLPASGLAVFRTQRLSHHAMRSVTQGVSQTMLIIAFNLMPLASAIAINFSAPLFTTLASAYFLKEAVGGARWAALAAGFVGVIVVANPGSDMVQIGALFALANAVMYGTVTAAVRGMTATESAGTLTLYQHIFLTAYFACLLPFGVTMPTAADAAVLVASGIMNGFGQYWWTRALHLAPASAVAPFYYFMLVWVMLLGFLVWGDIPTWSLVLGSAIVVASGLFLLWYERGRTAAIVE